MPFTRKLIIKNISKKYKNKIKENENIVEGDYEENNQNNNDDKFLK